MSNEAVAPTSHDPVAHERLDRTDAKIVEMENKFKEIEAAIGDLYDKTTDLYNKLP